MKHLKLLILAISLCLLPKIANAQVIELSETQLFEKVAAGYDRQFPYKGDKPCILLFHNGTCPYAKRIANSLESLSRQYQGKVYFYKVNLWNLSDNTLMNFQIEGSPTTFFFRIDGTGDYLQGPLNKEDLEEGIDYLLKVYN
ncbi:thiol reductase thioredoxin [Bacteroidia bacterium]|nr:thiol reductase thioredoxin [Bacteroidia bacterium]